MSGNTGREAGAIVGWLVMALWGWLTFGSAETLRTDSTMIRGDEKALFVSVSGGTMVALGAVLATLALVRLLDPARADGIPSATVSMVLGVLMVGLYVLFFAWGAALTAGGGVPAAGLLVIPCFMGGVAVIFGRAHRLARRPEASRVG